MEALLTNETLNDIEDELMGAKDYDFADDLPEYRGSNQLDYRSTKGQDKIRKRRKPPKSRAGVGGLHNRRNKHINW